MKRLKMWSILHKFEDGITKPIAYVSGTLIHAEKKNYSQIEKESLTIMYAIRNFTGS